MVCSRFQRPSWVPLDCLQGPLRPNRESEKWVLLLNTLCLPDLRKRQARRVRHPQYCCVLSLLLGGAETRGSQGRAHRASGAWLGAPPCALHESPHRAPSPHCEPRQGRGRDWGWRPPRRVRVSPAWRPGLPVREVTGPRGGSGAEAVLPALGGLAPTPLLLERALGPRA